MGGYALHAVIVGGGLCSGRYLPLFALGFDLCLEILLF